MNNEFDYIRNQTIGTVESVSPKEIKILLEINAPQNTAINTGVPQLFPKVNGFVLIPNEAGALIGIVSWIGIEHSSFPKRKGYKDFDLIDLPFPLRKLYINPVGVLKQKANTEYEIERGVFNYPSVGDIVVIPNQFQLRAIVQNKDVNARVKIGISSLAANAPVYVNPDRVFGRHIAILGNTGSGKSCSVAGLIRWSLKSAKDHLKNDKKLNARFIILDPNGEYMDAFNDLVEVRKFQIILNENETADKTTQQLKVPSWMWNSYEWSSIAQASGKTQRPLLRQALREIRSGGRLDENDELIAPRRYITSLLVSLRNFEKMGVAIADWPAKDNLGNVLQSAEISLQLFLSSLIGEPKNKIEKIMQSIHIVLESHPKRNGYYPAFNLSDIKKIYEPILDSQAILGELISYQGPDEDSPVFFENDDFFSHLETSVQESNNPQFMDFFLMRIRSILTDSRIASVIETKTKNEITLEKWLNIYIGNDNDNGTINIIDLSLIPSEILFVIISVLSRIIFEAHQRYRKTTGDILPTTLVVEEAHNFIRWHNNEGIDEITANGLCSQSFEKIAKEGRKFGLGLLISSQRPSELSQTVLSQCNTFLLHRLVNDKDQDMVKRLVPDNIGSILNELPVLPTQKAILLGWAAPLPIVVEMNSLEEEHRPKSKDPEFWNVWTGNSERAIDWKKITDDWQREEYI